MLLTSALQFCNDLLDLLIRSHLALNRFIWRSVPLRVLVVRSFEHPGKLQDLISLLMHLIDLLVFFLLLLFGTLFPLL